MRFVSKAVNFPLAIGFILVSVHAFADTLISPATFGKIEGEWVGTVSRYEETYDLEVTFSHAFYHGANTRVIFNSSHKSFRRTTFDGPDIRLGRLKSPDNVIEELRLYKTDDGEFKLKGIQHFNSEEYGLSEGDVVLTKQ